MRFATKPQLARQMIERAITAQILFACVTGDAVYGDNGPLRTRLEHQHIGSVLAVACDHRIPAGAGRAIRADELAGRLPRRAWQRLTAGEGAKGHRNDDWAWVTITAPGPGHRGLQDQPEQDIRIGISADNDCRSHLVPARARSSLIGQLNELVKAPVCGQRPGKS